MVPAFAMGMEDLQKRADAQAKAAESCKAKLDVWNLSPQALYLSYAFTIPGDSHQIGHSVAAPRPLDITPISKVIK